MPVATAGIIDQEWAELLKSWIAGDRYVDYYIERRNTGINIPIEADDSNRITSTARWIDSITGLRLRETNDPNNADIFFTQVDAQFFDNPIDEGSLGYTEHVTNGARDYFDVVYVDDEINDFSTQVDGVTINHEFGHALGLTHPYGDGFNANFTLDDTIMSYNPVPGSTIKYQDSDIAALKFLWGEAGTNYDALTSTPSPISGTDSFGYNDLRTFVRGWTNPLNKDNLNTSSSGKKITGTGDDDNINLKGSSSGRIIEGLGGNDVINGSRGKDRIYGGRGSDYIVPGTTKGKKDKDKIYLDKVSSPYEADVLSGLQKIDRIFIVGGSNNVTISSIDGGIGIYDGGALQAIYISKHLNELELSNIVSSI